MGGASAKAEWTEQDSGRDGKLQTVDLHFDADLSPRQQMRTSGG